jgi:hypothetical protein
VEGHANLRTLISFGEAVQGFRWKSFAPNAFRCTHERGAMFLVISRLGQKPLMAQLLHQ